MTPELKAKWITALRSGEYQQGKRYLKQNDKFCCLGVLADIVNDKQWQLKKADGAYSLPEEKSKTFYCLLSPKFLSNVDLEEDDQDILSGKNDQGESFSMIAAYIEENL